jgi:tRNA nucleotidyltransferase/poly(A) polymerase
VTLDAPPGVLEVARTLGRAGFQAWAVGGAVRDALLHLPATDWDLATDARPPQVRRVFRRTVPIGIEHGTVGVLARDGVLYEVTTFRRDVETFGRRAVVEFASTIEEDLARRDFTINALAWRPGTGELRDPFEGRADLARSRLRTVGEPAQRFAEDWLRVLRAIRFAGQLRLQIEAHTWAALVDAVPHLTELSAERVREELWKVLTATRTASVPLDLLRSSSALATLFPELAATVDLHVGAASGASAWDIAIRAVDALPPTRLLLRMAALLHLIGCPGARVRDLRGGWRFTGHETIGARKAEEVMRRLKASNAQVERVSTLVRLQRSLFPPDAPDAGVRRWLADVSLPLVYDLFRLRIAMWRADPAPGGERDLVERWRHAHRVLLEHPPLALADLAISGAELKQLGLQPGPRFGELLRVLLAEVIESPELNTREALLERVRAESAP